MDLNVPTEDLLSKSVIKQIPPSVHYIPEFITEKEEKELLQKINSVPLPKWTQLSHRRLQNWGGIPHPKGMIAEEIPKWLENEIDKIVALNIFPEDKRPNHALINEYVPGQGIMAHSDGPLFHPIVTTISCGSQILLDFYNRENSENTTLPVYAFSLLLEPRSLLILKEEIYHNYLHSINEKTIDVISNTDIKNIKLCSKSYVEGTIVKRTTRVSITIRHVPKTSKLKLKFGK